MIRCHGDTSLLEGMLLVVISDQEWFVVEPGGRMRLKHLDATEEVRLVPASSGRPAGVTGSIESFGPAPTREQRQAWLEEGALHAEIELERRANVSFPMVAPVSSVLPLLGDGDWLCVSSCSVYEAGDGVPSANLFEEDNGSPPKGPSVL